MPADAGLQNVERAEVNLAGFLEIAFGVFEGAESLEERVGGQVVDVEEVDPRAVPELDVVVLPVQLPVLRRDPMESAHLCRRDVGRLHQALQFLAADEGPHAGVLVGSDEALLARVPALPAARAAAEQKEAGVIVLPLLPGEMLLRGWPEGWRQESGS